ncbi:MAG: hypothetical protein AABZ30_06300 [Myxococcota bacterium]
MSLTSLVRRARILTLAAATWSACGGGGGEAESEAEAEAEAESEAEAEGEGELVVGAGDPDAPVFDPLPDDGTIPLFPGPQGGYHVYLQFRARGLDATSVWIDRRLIDADSGLVLVELREARALVDAGDGWRGIESGVQTNLCPSDIPGWALHDRAFDLGVVLTDMDDEARTIETKREIRPSCPDGDDACTDDYCIGCAAPPPDGCGP